MLVFPYFTTPIHSEFRDDSLGADRCLFAISTEG